MARIVDPGGADEAEERPEAAGGGAPLGGAPVGVQLGEDGEAGGGDRRRVEVQRRLDGGQATARLAGGGGEDRTEAVAGAVEGGQHGVLAGRAEGGGGGRTSPAG